MKSRQTSQKDQITIHIHRSSLGAAIAQINTERKPVPSCYVRCRGLRQYTDDSMMVRPCTLSCGSVGSLMLSSIASALRAEGYVFEEMA